MEIGVSENKMAATVEKVCVQLSRPVWFVDLMTNQKVLED